MKEVEITLLERCPHEEMGSTGFHDRTIDWWDQPQVTDLCGRLPAKVSSAIVVLNELAEPLEVLSDQPVSLEELSASTTQFSLVNSIYIQVPLRSLLTATGALAGRVAVRKIFEILLGANGFRH